MPSDYRTLDDDALLELARCTSEQERLVSTNAALIAGEIARRSSPELGSSGLAQRTGHRTPQELVRVTTGSTKREATTAVRVGQLVTEPFAQPWLEPLGAALSSQRLSVPAAEAIRNGLGEPSADITVAMLRDAAAELCAIAPSLDADRLLVVAREHRDAIDEAGIRDRELARRAQRGLRYRRLPDGMGHISWTLDPESSAVLGELFDRATSPRRGGPRFVNPDDAAAAERVLDDARTTEQLASDVFLELLRAGADADSSQLLGTGAPVVRVVVATPPIGGNVSRGRAGHVRIGHGGIGHGSVSDRSVSDRSVSHGRIEGQSTPVSIETVERLARRVDRDGDGRAAAREALDVGREQRLYTRQQRIALAVRDGGCRWPGCDRPPSWTEAHHIRHWARDHGSTDIADGILLCRHHHLLSHNNHWEIARNGGGYSLIPPPDIDRAQTPITMPTKSTTVRELIGAG